MANEIKDGQVDFCTECRRWAVYRLKKGPYTVNEGSADRTYIITYAVCTHCGACMSPPGLIDMNVREICAQKGIPYVKRAEVQ